VKEYQPSRLETPEYNHGGAHIGTTVGVILATEEDKPLGQ